MRTVSVPRTSFLITLVLALGSVVALVLRNNSAELVVGTPILYTNDQYGFALNFLPSWDGMQVTSITTGQYNYVAFTHPDRIGEAGRDGKLEFSVFVLDRPEQKFPDGALYLSERNGTRYAYAVTPAVAPSALAQAKEDFTGIISTFVSTER